MQGSVQQRSSTTSSSTTRRTMEMGDDLTSTYIPKASLKSVIVQRTGPGNRSSRSSMYGGSSSYSGQRMSNSFNPAIYSQMAGTGIADFRDHREKEKREMQDCNERLATYIEKVRWLEAKNKQLEAENDALRKRKQEDWRPIRDMYESELNQAREVIKELSTHKGVNDAKLAGLQDEIEALKDLISQYEINAKDYANKIDRLNSQIGEYEGELNSLRLRCGSLEDEIAKLRALIVKYKDENARLRADLDSETAAHIQQEVLAQTLQEENDFLNELLEKLQLTQQEPVQVKGMDMESFFKGELRKAIQDMSIMYDDKLDQMTMECESKVQHQMNQMKSGNVRDTMESEHAKSEVKRLREQLSEKNARIAQLESELAMMRADRDNKAGELSELKMEFEKMQVDYERKLADYQMQVEALMQQLQTLMDAKMSMELEIACYKKLLEGEENRTGLRQLVEQTIGMRGGGASQMAEIIGGGGMSGGGMGMSMSGGMGGGSSSSS
eukprot:TRINITY_DN1665_c0_g2_i11.p1 TRINITY_DN1665_c0_g2~~TRINITY_DN1665_c0_g2_i11.p1  ORF type:complete len:498 (+),score=166.69 TRINITY_DN1665_c0_g2_i11:137-1630(+)